MPRVALFAFLTDVVLVVLFAVIGRASHDEGVFGPFGRGLIETSWPFLAALAIGWLAALGWRTPVAPLRTGLVVWLVTVAGGMLLRALSGQGTALPFVIVATLALALLLIGWRVIASAVIRARERRHGTA